MVEKSAVIVGCGIMGCDIVAIFVKAGWRTQAIARGLRESDAIARRVAHSVVQLGGSAAPRVEILPSIDQVDWTDVGIVIESVTENLRVKQTLFQALDGVVPPQVPIGSNSSGMRITDIAQDCRTRDRMANTHFFLPAHLVPLVEIAKGDHTCDATVEALHEIFTSAGRVAVRVNRDVPGFLANRIQHALMREAFSVIDEGLATPEDVDAAVRYGFGFRYVAAGPILQKEFAGLDTQHAAATSIYPNLCNDAAPGRILSGKVAQGRFGVKTKQGFWDWTQEEIDAERARYEATLVKAAALLTPQSTEERLQ